MPTKITMHKVLALPSTLVPEGIYFVADGTDSTKCSIHIASTDGSSSRSVTSGTSSQPVITPIIADATLSAIQQDVLANSTLGSIDIHLPLVASNVEIRIFMVQGNNRVRIYANPGDTSNIIIGRNRITMNREYDSVTLVARAGKWFVAS